MTNTVHGNYFDKYATRNPIYRMLNQRFRKDWMAMLSRMELPTSSQSLLEIGCADGQFLNWYHAALPQLNCAIGLEPGVVPLMRGQEMFSELSFVQGSIYQLPYADNTFEIVAVPEVFEHLDDPMKGLEEVARVTSRYIIASVPWEPVWRICNILRGAYLPHLGNTPGHLQHFTRRGFVDFLNTHTRIIDVKAPFPWTMVLAEVQ